MITAKEAARIVLTKHKESVVTGVYDMGDKYVVSIKPKNWDDSEILLDPFFSVDKISKKVSEFSPLFDLAKWREVKDKPVYK